MTIKDLRSLVGKGKLKQVIEELMTLTKNQYENLAESAKFVTNATLANFCNQLANVVDELEEEIS